MAKRKQGFASMSPEGQREIARMGGRAAHKAGVAHQYTPEEAREAGSKGGTKTSRDRKYMAAIGRKGGLATHRRRLTLSVAVLRYGDGSEVGKVDMPRADWESYGEGKHPAYQWPQGIATAESVLSPEDRERLGLGPQETIYLSE